MGSSNSKAKRQCLSPFWKPAAIRRVPVQALHGESSSVIPRLGLTKPDIRFLSGARVLDTHIYAPKSYPFDLIAPITVMWRPMPHVARSTSSNGTESIAQTGELSAKRKEGKKANRVDKEKAPIQPSTMGQSGPDLERTVWVRVHPAAFDDVWGTLQAAASHAVNGASNSAPGESENEAVKLADLRGQLNVFEIMGPKANQVIKGALSPIGDDERDDFRKVIILQIICSVSTN
jgi:ribonuclease P/MRP protein subunit POP1